MSNENELKVPCYIRISKWHNIFAIVLIVNLTISPLSAKSKLYTFIGLLIYNVFGFFMVQRITAVHFNGQTIKAKGLFGKKVEFDFKSTAHFEFGPWNTYIHYSEDGQSKKFRIFCNRDHLTEFSKNLENSTGHQIKIITAN
jgi:hypothetical protein